MTLPPGFRYFRPTPARPAPAALNTSRPPPGSFAGPVVTDTPDGQVARVDARPASPPTPTTRCRSARRPGWRSVEPRRRQGPDRRTARRRTAGVVEVVDQATPLATRLAAPPVESDVLYLGYVDRRRRPRPVRLPLDAARPGRRAPQPPRRRRRPRRLRPGHRDRPANSPSPVATRTRAAVGATARGRGPRRLRRRLRARARRRRRRARARRADGRRPLGGAQTPTSKRSTRSRPTCCRSARTTAPTSNLPYVLRVREVDPPRHAGVRGVRPHRRRRRHDARPHRAARRPGDGDPRQPAASRRHVRRRGGSRRDDRARGVRGAARRAAASSSRSRATRRSPPRTPRGTPTRAAPTGPTRSSTRSPASSSGIRNGALPGVAAHPTLANVVVVGGDDIIPMARLDDTTRVGNETGLRRRVRRQRPVLRRARARATSSATTRTATSTRCSGRRAGSTCPSWRSGASSRRPTQIIAQLDAYADASGRLDASRAYAAGYDFMTDGAGSVRDDARRVADDRQRRAGRRHRPGRRVDVDAAPSCSATSPARRRPSVAAVFAHADHTALETADGDGVLAADLADGDSRRRPARVLDGLPLGSGRVGRDGRRRRRPPTTCPAAITARGAVYVASHRLRLRRPGQRRPAGAADDAVRRRARRRRVGRRRAAQRQAGVLRQPGPLRRVRREGAVEHDPVRAADVRRRHRAPGASGAADDRPSTPSPDTPDCSSTPTTRTSTSSSRRGDIGRWFEADAGTGPQLPQITASRPVQPRAELDVTAARRRRLAAPRPRRGRHRCSHTDRIVADFDAAFSRPTLDNAADEPEAGQLRRRLPDPAGRRHDRQRRPTGLIGPDGVAQRQKLVLIPGQFLAVRRRAPARGTQSLFDQMAGQVYYSASTDWTPPRVGDVGVERARRRDARPPCPSVAADLSGVHRVVALYQAGGDWQSGRPRPTTAAPSPARSPFRRRSPTSRSGSSSRSSTAPATWRGPPTRARVQPRRRRRRPARRSTLTPVDPGVGLVRAAPQITVDAGRRRRRRRCRSTVGPAEPYTGPFMPAGLGDGSHVVTVTRPTAAVRRVVLRLDMLTAEPTVDLCRHPPTPPAGATQPVTALVQLHRRRTRASPPAPDAQSTGAQEGAAIVLSGTATDRVGRTDHRDVDGEGRPHAADVPDVTLDPPSRDVDETTVDHRRDRLTPLSGLAGGEWWIGADPGVGLGRR